MPDQQRPHLPRIASIEAGRAFAAALVVLYHIDRYYFDAADYWRASVLGGLFRFGHAGVEFFFVLSGLIITMAHAGDIGRPSRVGNFCKNRFARIFPMYWLCLAVMIAMQMASSNGKGFDAGRILVSILLVGPDPHASLLFVGWTLFHEMLFYALFGLAIWRPRLGLPLLAAWLAAAALLPQFHAVSAYPAGMIDLLFGLGIAAGLVLQRGDAPAPVLVAGLGAGLFLATGVAESCWHFTTRPLLLLGYGMGAMLALVGLVSLERRHGLRVPPLLQLIGKASYSIYLTHMLILPPLAWAAGVSGATRLVPAPLAFALLSVAAIAFGIIVHLAVEVRLVRLARTRLDRPWAPVSRPAGRMAHP